MVPGFKYHLPCFRNLMPFKTRKTPQEEIMIRKAIIAPDNGPKMIHKRKKEIAKNRKMA